MLIVNNQLVFRTDGDVSFQSQRRLWMETAANAGVKTFGYLFTQPQPTVPPALGGASCFFVKILLTKYRFQLLTEPRSPTFTLLRTTVQLQRSRSAA
jgi:hypothetical protein